MSTLPRDTVDHAATPWLLLAALLASAPHTLHQPVWLSLFAGTMWLWSAGLWHQDRRLPNRWWLITLVISGCTGIFLEYRTLFGRDAGVALLVMLMSLKLLEIKTRRDAMVLITLGYFLLLTHYFYTQSIPTGLWLLLSLWLITATLVRLQGGAPSSLRNSLRHAALLSAQALPFMLVLYLLFPRINGPLWGLPQDAHRGQTGLSETMQPGSIAELAQNGEIAFRVRFDGEIPAKDKLYWRGPVMEDFDGRIWRPAGKRNRQEGIEPLAPAIRYETTLEAHNQRWLLALDAPTELPQESTLNGRLTVSNKEAVATRQRFRLASSLVYRFNVDEDQDVLQRNLALPNNNPQTKQLARQWKTADDRPESIIRKALDLFAESFYYTLRPPLLGANSVDDFLFQTRRGFCEHYAAAFVVLMRHAGIPARVVSGYQGGERNPVDDYLVVRQSDAHAWAEVWLQGRGWIRVDPTAAVSPARIESGIVSALPEGEPLPGLIQIRSDWLQSMRYRWEAVNNAWNQQVLGYNPQRQRELLARLGLPDADWQSLAALLSGIGSLLLATLSAWVLYQRPRTDPATRLWHKALRHLARRQVHCAPWETPLALAQRVRDERPELAEAFERVVAAYVQARYGPQNNDLNILRQAVAQLP